MQISGGNEVVEQEWFPGIIKKYTGKGIILYYYCCKNVVDTQMAYAF